VSGLNYEPSKSGSVPTMMMTIAKSSNVIGNFKHETNHRHRHSALGYRTSAEYATTCSHTHPVACEIN
jgi:putative transposase